MNLNQETVMPTLDPNEAPDGYAAALKSPRPGGDNICRSCDWRPTCQDPTTDFSKPGHRCMDYPIISIKTGQVVQRQDGCSVVFKKKET